MSEYETLYSSTITEVENEEKEQEEGEIVMFKVVNKKYKNLRNLKIKAFIAISLSILTGSCLTLIILLKT